MGKTSILIVNSKYIPGESGCGCYYSGKKGSQGTYNYAESGENVNSYIGCVSNSLFYNITSQTIGGNIING
jgi:hypothetical protein